MYVSPCAAHYYRQRYEGMDAHQLAEQRRLLQEGLRAIEEEQTELAALPARAAAKLRGSLERDAMDLRSKLAAVEELLAERAAKDGE